MSFDEEIRRTSFSPTQGRVVVSEPLATACNFSVDDGPIPMDVINPAALVAFAEFLEAEAVEVDLLTLGRGLILYWEVASS